MTNAEAFTAAHALTRYTIKEFGGGDYRATEAETWLDHMPAAECPEGCVVRRGGLRASVVWNRDGDWSVQYLAPNRRLAAMGEEGRPGDGGPESAGWRHALDHRLGFSYVWSEVQAHCGYIENDHSAEFGALQRWIHGELTDADLIQLARAYAAVLAKSAS